MIIAWPQCGHTKVGNAVPALIFSAVVLSRAGRRLVQQLTRQSEARLAAAVGEQPVVADAMEASW